MSAEAEIRTYAERIVSLEIERRERAADIKDIKAEAKGRGYSPKLLTACVRMLLLEADKRAAALSDHEELDLYLSACGLLSGRGGEDDETAPRQEEFAGHPALDERPASNPGGENAQPSLTTDYRQPAPASAVERVHTGSDSGSGSDVGAVAQVSPEEASDLQTDERVRTGGLPRSEGAQVGFGPRSPGMGAESPGNSSPSGWPRAGLQNQAQGVRLPPAVPDHGRHSVVAGGAA